MTDDALAELLTLTRKVSPSGTVSYRDSDGQLHRQHGPAIIYPDGSNSWYWHGEWIGQGHC